MRPPTFPNGEEDLIIEECEDGRMTVTQECDQGRWEYTPAYKLARGR